MASRTFIALNGANCIVWRLRLTCESPQQGPAGKDGLPGHPGQRGETVSPKNEISGEKGGFGSRLSLSKISHS